MIAFKDPLALSLSKGSPQEQHSFSGAWASTSSARTGFVAKALIALARGWQIGPSRVLPPTCRFAPSCSAYAIEAVQRHGAARGGWLAFRRFIRCHPWGGHGYDPVP